MGITVVALRLMTFRNIRSNQAERPGWSLVRMGAYESRLNSTKFCSLHFLTHPTLLIITYYLKTIVRYFIILTSLNSETEQCE